MQRASFFKSMAWAAVTLMYGWRVPNLDPVPMVELWGMFDEGEILGWVWRHSQAVSATRGFETLAQVLDGWMQDPKYIRQELRFFTALPTVVLGGRD